MGYRHLRLALCSASLTSAVVGLSSGVRADTFGLQIHSLAGATHVRGLELTPADGFEEPPLLDARTLSFDNEGSSHGVGVRMDWLLDDEVRFGLGVSALDIDDLRLSHESLPPGTRAELAGTSLWSYESFFGAEVEQGPVYLYLDARVAVSRLVSRVELHDADRGLMGTTNYSRWSLGVGPRLGALIPIGHSLMLDVGVHHRLIGGQEQWHAYLGLGYWENDRSDPFSEGLRGGPRGDF